jgi:hypothetical protein
MQYMLKYVAVLFFLKRGIERQNGKCFLTLLIFAGTRLRDRKDLQDA